ncbi:hypothetical protein DCAR_0626043 [Daucus carota subsp. sativus]|uniref:RRM domain-containing protein n=1 Tax=Daucus carota subsp. sativus TaxID=79200 RepID=A0A161ZYG3_DAUCS|nr:PREDICTED: polyadenylate-binding protein-interacting protein 12-like isoform X1 [Daucus carota subsp. sativus]XP_017257235.1 PREDICTED: polyadenylate-binding protein-interacting protein 12-like isoform X1 [Daucus carota subsp. sativus]WOH06615.1 hypothetical protein DCAR_0626043 [Daucus carota subsp. sativus]
MAARGHAEFNVGKPMNWRALFVKNDMNESESSSARNFSFWSSDQNDQVQNWSNDSAVAEQQGLFQELGYGVAHQHPVNVGNDLMLNKYYVDEEEEGFEREMRDLEQLLSNLDPLAQDYVPPMVDHAVNPVLQNSAPHFGCVADGNTWMPTNSRVAAARNYEKKKQTGSSHGKGRANDQTTKAERKEAIKRTVFVPDINNQVTEEELADLFVSCGQIAEIRICGDPKSILRFAFVEFTDQKGAKNALRVTGKMLRCQKVKVLPSKTAIAPINPKLLPTSEVEREKCSRTIYCTNIDPKVIRKDIKHFFESICGEVVSMRVLGDKQHPTRIAFVEFVTAESAVAALNCSGVIIGSLPIRISPSKTPVKSPNSIKG